MSESTLAAARARHPALADATFGAVVTLVLSFVPFSSVAGGAVAAFRYGGGYLASLWLGALSGTVAAVPLVVFFVPALRIVGRLGFGVAPSSPAYDLFLALVVAFFLVYTVGFGALGGLAGAWTRHNTDRDLSLEGWF